MQTEEIERLLEQAREACRLPRRPDIRTVYIGRRVLTSYRLPHCATVEVDRATLVKLHDGIPAHDRPVVFADVGTMQGNPTGAWPAALIIKLCERALAQRLSPSQTEDESLIAMASTWFRTQIRRRLGLAADEMPFDTPKNRTIIESIAAECKRRFPMVESLGTVDLRGSADEIKLNLSIADSPPWQRQVDLGLRACCVDPNVSHASLRLTQGGERGWRCQYGNSDGRLDRWELSVPLGRRIEKEAARLGVKYGQLLEELGVEPDIPF